MPGFNLFSRLDKASIAKVVFDGVTYGLTSTPVVVFNITGQVWIAMIAAYCPTTLVGSGATVELGTANSANSVIGSTTASNIQTNKWWVSTSPSTDEATPIGPIVLANGPLSITIGTANVTAGELDFFCWWHPLSAGANII